MNLILGDFTYGTIGGVGHGTVEVGKYCSLASGITAMFFPDHRTDWVSTYPFPVLWHIDVPGHPVNPENIIIGNDVWIGKGAILLSGTKINDGAVIGAFSVIKGEVPAYSVAVGNPAKIIKKRFSEEIIKKLLDISWWNWPEEKVVEHVEMLCSSDIEGFVRKFHA